MCKELIKVAELLQLSNDFMDKDHKELVDNINGLWQLVNKDSKQHPVYSEIICEFKELIDHFRDHFSREEELMEKIY